MSLASKLDDPATPGPARAQDADAMVRDASPAGVDAVVRLLGGGAPSPAKTALAEAIARTGGGNRAFVKPLAALVASGGDEAVPSAAALAAYADPRINDQLMAVCKDTSVPVAGRVAAVRALGRAHEKTTIEAMVSLLDDADDDVRQAAAESLGEMTGVRTMGAGREAWKQWWAANKDVARADWLADLSDRMGQDIALLKNENALLRQRLGASLRDLYNAAPPETQNAMLPSLLTDTVADVRLVGTVLAEGRLTGGQQLTPKTEQLVEAMLSDVDPRCRRAAALLYADLSGAQPSVLAARLGRESQPSVREGLLLAIGKMKNADMLPVLMNEIDSTDELVAAAAAEATGRTFEANSCGDELHAGASAKLCARYRTALDRGEGAELRESLLTAMGPVGGNEPVEVMESALSDRAAKVRLAAVSALTRLRVGASVARIEPLLGDSDRGVRHAAVSAVGALGGEGSLPLVLRRTEPGVEGDPAVRQRAWEVTTDMLSRSDTRTIARAASILARRTDATDQRIAVLQMLTKALDGDGGLPLANARRQLGSVLLAAGRPAEAGPMLADAWRYFDANGANQARDAWLEWIDALLAADDPAVAAAMGDQEDDSLYADALERLGSRLEDLLTAGDHDAGILLATTAGERLSHRLTTEQQERIATIARQAGQARLDADRQAVVGLVASLESPREPDRKSASDKLLAMGSRAVAPLLEELRDDLSADVPRPGLEGLLLPLLSQLAPELTLYAPDLPAEEKIAAIEGLLAARE
jgi:HEAT repeat protein